MNFLDSLSQALFGGLGGGGGGSGPVSSLLQPAGLSSEGDGQKMGGMGALSQAGGPMSGLSLLGGLSGGATGSAPLINAFRDAFMGGDGKDKMGGGTGTDAMAGAGPAAPAPAPASGMLAGLSSMAGNPALTDAAKTALPAAPPAPAGGMTPDTGAEAYPETKPDPQKFMGMTGNDWRDVLKAVFAGAAGVDPRRPGLSAFAQGASGTFNAFDKQASDRAATETAAEDRMWKREDRTIAADDRQYNRKMDTAKNARDERMADVKNISALARTMKDLRGSTELTMDQKFKLNDQLYRYADKINKNGVMTTEELNAALDKERDRLMLEYGVKKAPAGGGGSQAPAAGGGGQSQQAPARPTSREAFDQLPSGAWFVNPADGRVMQKK